MRKNGFDNEDYISMDERQRYSLLEFIDEKEKRDKLEFKLMLLQVIKWATHAVQTKDINKQFCKIYDESYNELNKLLGIKVDNNRFKYQGGRKGFNKI